jgi:hypothetical protein
MDPTRLDATESYFFQNQLKSVDQKMYEKKYAELAARRHFPTQDGVDEGMKVYEYRTLDRVGRAQWIADPSQDLPRVGALGETALVKIKDCGASYGYTIKEIKTAAKLGVPLDATLAFGARKAIEQEIDEALSIGNTAQGLVGALKIASGTTSFTPGTKAAGGTSWGTITAPNATGDEVYADIVGICAAIVKALKGNGAWQKFRVLLPVDAYNYAGWIRMGPDTPTTALQAALAHPNVESVQGWHRCDTAGSGSVTRMMAYPYDADVLACLVPQEIRSEAAQLRNLSYVVPVTASCGGVVCRYPVAVSYGDSI